MTFSLEPVERDDPRVLDLYADFVREADGPLVYDREDTSDYLTPAVGLYRSAGYREVPAYNENPKADLWFERSLGDG